MSHIVHLTTVEHVTRPVDTLTATEAIESRIHSLRALGHPFERDGMTLRFEDNGVDITITYEET